MGIATSDLFLEACGLLTDMGPACLCVKKAQRLCAGTKPWGKVYLGVLPGFWFTCLKPAPTKCVHLDAAWDMRTVDRAGLKYWVICGFSRVAFVKLKNFLIYQLWPLWQKIISAAKLLQESTDYTGFWWHPIRFHFGRDPVLCSPNAGVRRAWRIVFQELLGTSRQTYPFSGVFILLQIPRGCGCRVHSSAKSKGGEQRGAESCPGTEGLTLSIGRLPRLPKLVPELRSVRRCQGIPGSIS